MSEPNKLADKAAQAAQAAGPVIDRAKELAGELAEKAAPLVEKAADRAAQGISSAAEQLDKVTGGKYAGPISSVSAKIEQALDREK